MRGCALFPSGMRGEGADGRADGDAGEAGETGARGAPDGMRAADGGRTVCGSARTASVSVFRIASSSANRSRVISASAIGGVALRS